GNENDSVEEAQVQVQHVARDPERGRKGMPVDGIGEEQPAEEKNFGDQKDPHAQRGGFFLLLQRLKLSVQLSGAMHAVLLFLLSRQRHEAAALRQKNLRSKDRGYKNRDPNDQSSPCAGMGLLETAPSKPSSGRCRKSYGSQSTPGVS